MLTQEMIQEAYKALEDSKTMLFAAVELEISTKEKLELAKSGALLELDKINGKNAEIREAQLREATRQEYAELKTFEQAKREAVLKHELAALKVSCYKDMLKLGYMTIGGA